MKLSYTYIFLICMVLIPVFSYSQTDERTVTLDQVMEIVKRYHPVAKQADILVEKAKADVTIARSGFDPLLSSNNAFKTFDGTEYYRYNNPEIKIPTWFGIEVQAGFENLTGNYTDPQATIGKTSYVGISVPLAKNLLMDKRRATLQTAKIFAKASETEKRIILNDLLSDAAKNYWYWVLHYQVYKIMEDAVRVNERRLELVKTGYRLGDRPAIDTTEAISQLQNFQLQKENAWLQFQNATLEVSVFLWGQNNEPYTLPDGVIPADAITLKKNNNDSLPVLTELLAIANKNHPELLIYNYKLNALDVDKKLKFQQLLPTANFKYNQLGSGYSLTNAIKAPLFENNFQYGFSLGIPLRLSEGRGEYQKAKLKITETKFEQNLKKMQVENKVRSYFNEMFALKKQLNIQEAAYQNYRTLQRAEESRFQAGESSLFLINTRENKTLESLQKLQELQIKYLITANNLQWATGTLFNQ